MIKIAQDIALMDMAYSLAEKARGQTSPNPCVGALIVKEGKIVGWGCHQEAGSPHAEIVALDRAGNLARGSTLYLTLEPCIHWGKTPPCADRLVKAGFKQAIISTYDPNPLVYRKGVAKLRAAGIKVVTGVLAEKQARLNETYNKYIVKKIPFVTLKAALSLDGKIAASSGDARWISSDESRRFGQELRAEYDGIITGINTILVDDPLLTVRLEHFVKKRWSRIILDSKLRFPLEARLLKNLEEGKVLIFTSYKSSREKAKRLTEKGAEVICVPERKNRLSLRAILKELGRREIASVLVEGGAGVMTSFLEQKLPDKAFFFISPKLIGGAKAPTMFEGQGAGRVSRATELKNIRTLRLKDDIIIEGYF
ncbi:MAG: bifunctional diaminohydroxyphosphoribosylaminopyrimidine deaminase/5-amino-6-(5-phosphoribosylamino)uracil reductase RibD [Acidobacteriota bacterium]|nr:bifunctional diaminohydroxyphosphoribosylaminopyrimidine deaminase/5-amino-6-(5-phosphoribosylamino)uracil reductase RibD [Acidobacteriota bacterium]